MQNLISWKHTYKRLNEEYETARKKKHALDNLLGTSRISQSTYDLFNAEIAESLDDIDRQQKGLLQKMDSKMTELEDQIKTLEILLANFEIQHVTGDIDDDVYQRDINVLSLGLDTSRQELDVIKEASTQISSGKCETEQIADQQLANDDVKEEKLQSPVVELVADNQEPSESPQEPIEEGRASRVAEAASEDKEEQKN